MAKPRSKVIHLAEWASENPDKTNDLVEFDESEWVEVRPFGSLPRELAEEIIDIENTPTPAEAKQRIEMRRRRMSFLMPKWHLLREDGTEYPTPSENPDVWLEMDNNLEVILNNAAFDAFETREEKRKRAGEGSNSSMPSAEVEDTASLTS